MAEEIESVVLGAGVVGLAVARALAQGGREVVVLEAAETIGTETSSRNSEVIHAGIYYPAGSLKATLCVRGREALYPYCESHGVEHRRLGKLIAATTEGELPILEDLKARAEANGVDDLEWLTGEEARQLEPELRAVGALLSPSTGILNSHALMLAYQGEAEDAGAMIAFRSRFERGLVTNNGFRLDVADASGTRTTIRCREFVNSAGLHAQRAAHALEGLSPAHIPPLHLCKGNYFRMSGRQPFRRLIYPVPQTASLGIHVTLDLAGQVRFGPDQEWMPDDHTGHDGEEPILDYSIDEGLAPAFADAIRRYYPRLDPGKLYPDYAGLRPKLQAPGEPAADFAVHGPERHQVPGLVNLFGIESPGITASLAIADLVRDALDG